MNESYHVWKSHVAYEWDVSHFSASCHIWMSHGKCECVIAYNSCHVWKRHVTCEWVTSQMKQPCRIWMSHVTMLHTWMSHITYERHVTYKWVVSPMNFSCHIWMSSVLCSRVMSHMHKLFQECPYYWFAIMSNIILLCTIVWVGRIPKLYA